jgi:hypothetical protein
MDADQFDGLLRQISQARSRRGVLLGVLGGAVGLLGLTEAEAKRKKKKKKKGSSPPPAAARCPASCPPCQQCVDGRSCTPRPDGITCGDSDCKTCQSGACVNKPDETLCNDSTGKCLQGTCNPPPICFPFGATCTQGGSPACCGAGMVACQPAIGGINQCRGLGAAGSSCLAPLDCLSTRCVGFVCQ